MPKYNSSKRISVVLCRKGVTASPRTVRRDLRQARHQYRPRPISQGLTAVQKEKRVQFSLNYKEDTSKLIFSDEKVFDTNDNRMKMWVKKGETPAKRLKVRWAPKCQVWGAIGINWRCLKILSSRTSITHETYIDTLKHVYFPRKRIFQQDGATAHTAKATINYLNKRKINLLKNWPPNSPDLSPIENIWSMVQQDVNEKLPSTVSELQRCILNTWSSLPTEMINDTILSFDRRLKACVKLGGEKVKKW